MTPTTAFEPPAHLTLSDREWEFEQIGFTQELIDVTTNGLLTGKPPDSFVRHIAGPAVFRFRIRPLLRSVSSTPWWLSLESMYFYCEDIPFLIGGLHRWSGDEDKVFDCYLCALAKPYACPRCVERGQSWVGDPPRCAFKANGKFSGDNWNCATMNALRKEAEKDKAVVQAEDENVAILHADDHGFFLIGWHKSRGKTDSFLRFNPTVSECMTEVASLRDAQILLGDISIESD